MGKSCHSQAVRSVPVRCHRYGTVASSFYGAVYGAAWHGTRTLAVRSWVGCLPTYLPLYLL